MTTYQCDIPNTYNSLIHTESQIPRHVNPFSDNITLFKTARKKVNFASSVQRFHKAYEGDNLSSEYDKFEYMHSDGNVNYSSTAAARENFKSVYEAPLSGNKWNFDTNTLDVNENEVTPEDLDKYTLDTVSNFYEDIFIQRAIDQNKTELHAFTFRSNGLTFSNDDGWTYTASSGSFQEYDVWINLSAFDTNNLSAVHHANGIYRDPIGNNNRYYNTIYYNIRRKGETENLTYNGSDKWGIAFPVNLTNDLTDYRVCKNNTSDEWPSVQAIESDPTDVGGCIEQFGSTTVSHESSTARLASALKYSGNRYDTPRNDNQNNRLMVQNIHIKNLVIYNIDAVNIVRAVDNNSLFNRLFWRDGNILEGGDQDIAEAKSWLLHALYYSGYIDQMPETWVANESTYYNAQEAENLFGDYFNFGNQNDYPILYTTDMTRFEVRIPWIDSEYTGVTLTSQYTGQMYAWSNLFKWFAEDELQQKQDILACTALSSSEYLEEFRFLHCSDSVDNMMTSDCLTWGNDIIQWNLDNPSLYGTTAYTTLLEDRCNNLNYIDMNETLNNPDSNERKLCGCFIRQSIIDATSSAMSLVPTPDQLECWFPPCQSAVIKRETDVDCGDLIIINCDQAIHFDVTTGTDPNIVFDDFNNDCSINLETSDGGTTSTGNGNGEDDTGTSSTGTSSTGTSSTGTSSTGTSSTGTSSTGTDNTGTDNTGANDIGLTNVELASYIGIPLLLIIIGVIIGVVLWKKRNK